MKSNKVAVIDLGTNTFHLIIAKCTDYNWEILHKEKQYVRLGEGGLGHISIKAIDRAIITLEEYASTISRFSTTNIIAIGTAALRSADNQVQFVNNIFNRTGIQIEIIDGQTEANYIHKGVLKEVVSNEDNFIIMDIGGGSVEYIHSNSGQSLWFDSYNTGIAELFKLFPPENPISENNINEIFNFLHKNMATMFQYWDNISKNHPKTLIGASGSFEVIFDILSSLKLSNDTSTITKNQFNKIYQYIMYSTLEERVNMSFLPKERRELIVIALAIIKFVMDEFGFDKIQYASYALKEGVLAEYCREI